MQNKHIGFIGLGQMGAPMARMLIKSGYQLTGYDVNPFTDSDISIAETAHQIAEQSDIIITMLPNEAFDMTTLF